MAQPPPRKDAYSRFIVNLHKEHFNNLQAKNQSELDILDDIKNFMKQKATIEKTYAESLHKLSTVYGSKKIASKVGLDVKDGEQANDNNIYQLWMKVLEENEKIANLRLAAAQVFQEKISDEAKNLRSSKAIKAKKFIDRLQAVQKEVQESVVELDRTRLAYYTEESEAIRTATRAEEADLKAKGKKKDMMSMFQSRTALEKQADKLSAKQEELNIKSTGARNDYLLAIETANAHQTQYYQTCLKKCIAGTECGVYGSVAEYVAVLTTTELATCSAHQASLSTIREGGAGLALSGSLELGEEMVQYSYEPVQGDQVSTVTKPEHDAGINYALSKDAKETAEKYNNSLRMIKAFSNRKAALNKAKKAGQDTANLSDKIEELEDSIDNAETEKAKAISRLNKLREGGVSVDEYMVVEKAEESNMDWDSEEDSGQQVQEVNYYSYDQVNYKEPQQADWGESTGGWESSPPPPPPETSSDPSAEPEISQALVLYNFDATNSDELTVSEGEWVNLLISQAQEEGWVMAENREGQTGLVPASFVTETTPEEYEASLAAEQTPAPAPLDGGWGVDQPSVPACPPPVMEDDNSSEEESSEESDEDDGGPPPGLAPPPGPPPSLAPPPGPPPPAAPVGEIAGKYKALYQFVGGAEDELSLTEGEVVTVLARGEDQGWLLGQLGDRKGIFPESYVTPLSQDREERTISSSDEEYEAVQGGKKEDDEAVHGGEKEVDAKQDMKEETVDRADDKKEDIVNGEKTEDSKEDIDKGEKGQVKKLDEENNSSEDEDSSEVANSSDTESESERKKTNENDDDLK